MTSEQLTTADLANAAANGKGLEQHPTPLLPGDFSEEMRTRWETIQTAFVDDPRVSVQHADELVASAIKRLAETFAQERSTLEQQWSTGNDVSTEDLRQALRRYRAFFQRILSV
ncbi:MAG TPA: hypothetical protein VGF49_02160 [Candidatus Solibacter sp.]|jgi:hypothetical protein